MADPKCTKDVRKFLRFRGYYKQFVEVYTTIARLLNDLLVCHPANPEARNKKSAKPTPFIWGEEQQKSFEMIINRLTSPPELGYVDYQLPFTQMLQGLNKELTENLPMHVLPEKNTSKAGVLGAEVSC